MTEKCQSKYPIRYVGVNTNRARSISRCRSLIMKTPSTRPSFSRGKSTQASSSKPLSSFPSPEKIFGARKFRCRNVFTNSPVRSRIKKNNSKNARQNLLNKKNWRSSAISRKRNTSRVEGKENKRALYNRQRPMITRQRKSILKKDGSFQARSNTPKGQGREKRENFGGSHSHKGQPPGLTPRNRLFWANVSGPHQNAARGRQFSKIKRSNGGVSKERVIRHRGSMAQDLRRGSKQFLEDQYMKFEDEYCNDKAFLSMPKRKKKGKVEWRCPIESERIITDSEPGSLEKGCLTRFFSYLCIYLPAKVCMIGSKDDSNHN